MGGRIKKGTLASIVYPNILTLATCRLRRGFRKEHVTKFLAFSSKDRKNKIISAELQPHFKQTKSIMILELRGR